MSLEFLDYLEDILDAMEKAEFILQDVSYQEFEDDFVINFATVRALEIIGEATKRLPLNFRDQYEIPRVKPLIQQILDDYEADEEV